MSLSVTEPVGKALNKTRSVLFQPFDALLWIKLGFCAWLSQLGDSSGGSGNLDLMLDEEGSPRFGGPSAPDFGAPDESLAVILAIAGAVLLVVLVVVVLCMWLQSRGRFMFLDGVVRKRGAVVEPWREYRREGNSLFKFKILFALAVIFGVLLSAGLGTAIAWEDLQAERLESGAVTGLVVGVSLTLVIAIGAMILDTYLNDFVVPAMYARRITVGEGWAVVRAEVLDAHLGASLLYLVMKVAIAFVTFALVLGFVCATMCVAACFLAIPYVGTVLLLPLFVFNRAYSLHFLEQLGGSWDLFSRTHELEGVFE